MKTLKQSEMFDKTKNKLIDFTDRELTIGKGIMKVGHLPCEAPWLNGYGACLIQISDVKREGDEVLFQLADEHSTPYNNGKDWCKADDFFDEWPD
jgi:hypothetical protein